MTPFLASKAAWARSGGRVPAKTGPRHGAALLFALLIPLSGVVAAATNMHPAKADEPGREVSDELQPSSAVSAPRSIFRSRQNEPGPNDRTTELPALQGSDGRVTSSDLDAVGVETPGLLDPEGGGYGYDLWRGSSRAAIEPLMEALPGPGLSAARQKLYARLLLSRAYDPAGDTKDTPFLTRRARKLFDVGMLNDAQMILEQADDAPTDLVSRRLKSELDLLTHKTRSACATAARTRHASDDPWWSRLRTLCYVVAGDRAAAQLGADLLAEQGYEDPLFFLAVANRIDQAGLPYGDLALEDAVHFALLADGEDAFEDGFPKEVLGTTSSALLSASLLLADLTARSADDLVRIRIPLAEQGVLKGSVVPDRLAVLYGSVIFSEAEAAALTKPDFQPLDSDTVPSVRKSSAIYQAMSSAVTPTDRAKLLKTAWDEASKFSRRPLFVALYSEVLLSLPVDPALDIYAADFAAASLLAGAWVEAGQWLQLARQAEARKGVGAGPALDYLLDLGAALFIVAPEAAKLEPEWNAVDRLSLKVDSGTVGQALLEVRLYEAFGGRLDGEIRQALADYPPAAGGRMPATGVLSGLDAAARAGRRGEVVLLTLSALGDSKSAQIPISVTSKCVSGLWRTGFTEEAKTLAIESLLADL